MSVSQRVRMESVGSQGSCAGAPRLLLVPSPIHPDLQVDLDEEDEDIVIGIRPKSSPQPRRKTSISEEESDLSEPPSLSGSRRVSFADAVGLSLVQVKEFDKWDVPQLPDFLDLTSQDEDEYFISPFNFPTPLPSDEMIVKLLDEKVVLQSLELIPRTSILKGVIHVLNISFTKAVYVRTSLDDWLSHFDLLSEFVPGSSDGHSDTFSFRLTLGPPFAEQGAKVHFCLRYETQNGTFWANNGGKNYVLFCHERKKAVPDQTQRESKKSCLKAVSQSFSLDDRVSSLEPEKSAADETTQQNTIHERENTIHERENTIHERETNPSNNSTEDSVQENRRNHSRRNRRKAVRVARIKDYFAQKNITDQNKESQASPETQTPAAEEQNQTLEKSNPEGSVPFADDALGSDSMTRENLDLADDMDGVESKAVPIEACSCVEASSEVSTQKDPGERLVSFAFGTVLAPLYQEVSGRAVGRQLYSETSNKHMKKQQEIENETMNVRHACVGRSCDDRNDERTNKVDNAVEKMVSPTLGLPEVLCSTGSDIVDSEQAIRKEDSSSEHRETIVTQTPQTRLIEIENFDENRDETVLETKEQDGLSNKIDDFDDPSLEYSKKNVAIPQSPTLFQEELTTLSFQLSHKDILQRSFNVPSGTGLECVDQSLDISRKVQSDASLSPLVEPACSTIPSLDTESCSALTSPVHRVEICEDTLYSNRHLSKNVDVAFLTRNAIDETSQEFENQTMLVISKHSSKPPNENKHVSATNTSKFKNEPSQDSEVKNVNVSSIYEEENPLITFPLRPSVETPEKDLFLLLDQNKSLLEELKHRCKLTGEVNPDTECPQTTLSTDPLLLEHNNDSENCATMGQNVEEKACLLERKSPYCHGNFTEEIYFCEAGSVDITLNRVREEITNLSLEESESDKITQPGELNMENDSNMLPILSILGGETLAQKECFLDNLDLGLDYILSEMDLLPCPESSMEENESFPQDYNLSSVGLVAAPLDTVSLSVESGREQDLTDFISNANSESTGYEIIANCFEKLEDIQSVNIKKHGTSTDEEWEASVQSEDVVESKTKNDCVFASENEEHSKTLSLTQTEDGVIERLDSESSLSVDFKNTAEDSDTLVAPEVFSKLFFKEIYPSGSNEKNISVCASVASIEGRILDSINNTPQCECDDRERETIKRQLKTRDEERFKIPPRQAKRKFSASIAKNIPSQDDPVEAGSCVPTEMDQTLDLGSSKDANGNTFSCMELIQNESLTDNSSGSKRPHDHSGIYMAPCESNMEEHSSLSQVYESSSVGLVDTQSDTSSPLDESGLEQDFPETAAILEREEKIYNLKSESKGHEIIEYENLEVEQDCVENQKQQISNDEELKTSNQCFANVVESKTSFYVDHPVRLELQIEASLEDGAKELKKDNEIEKRDILLTHVEEKELDGRIMDSNDNMPKYKLSDIVEDIEIIKPTSEGDRFKVPPRKVKRKLQAQKVQKSPLSVQDEIEVKRCIPIEIDANDSTFSDGLDYYKNTDDESNSESESGSEDEMELYMHCLRAVYGQQRSTKATKPEQKRLPSTKTKRSTSLPSISEALDEEQTDINHRHEDESPVQTIAATLPKEEDDDNCWKKMFSYRKVLKSLLFVTFAVLFLAVSYHYDFIACFGLYLLSLIWLFFQGDKQNRKHNRGL